MSDKKVRLSKRMSELGLSSRREADKLIEQGLVSVNGSTINTLGYKVLPEDTIELLKEAKNQLSQKITVMLNKPVGYVSSQPEEGYESAMTLLQKSNRVLNGPSEKLQMNMKNLAPTGRLDIDSRGLIIYTQDGVIAKHIIGENSKIDKEYIVQFEGELTEMKLNKLKFGLSLDGKKLKRAEIIQENEYTIKMVLREGKKRQIRRMLDQVKLRVTHLKRTRIGPIHLGELELHNWRLLTKKELKAIINYNESQTDT